MQRKTKKQSQSRKVQQPARQRSQEEKKKELTLDDLSSVTGGFSSLPELSLKMEDRAGNKGEAE